VTTATAVVTTATAVVTTATAVVTVETVVAAKYCCRLPVAHRAASVTPS
jgi:hypothetical protein